MRGKLVAALLIFTGWASGAVAELPEVAPRPEEFVDEAHEKSFASYENLIKAARERAERSRMELSVSFERSVRERISELAGTGSPERVRELQKVTERWFDAKWGKRMEEVVPKELADVVSGFASALENIESERATRFHLAYRNLRGQWEQLAAAHEAAPDGKEKAEILRGLVGALKTRPDAVAKWGETEIATYQWDRSGPQFTEAQRVGDELLALGFISGTMAGGAESLLLKNRDGGETMVFEGKSGQPNLKASVYAIRHPQLKVADWKLTTESIWRSDKKKKLIHQSRGFAYLAGFWGSWGNLTHADVKLDPEDGFYYLTFRSENLWSGAYAVIVEYPEGSTPPDFKMTTAEWRRGDPVKELIDAKDGVCLLTGISGAFNSGNVMLTVGTDGKWRLSGRSGHLNTGAKALVLRFE